MCACVCCWVNVIAGGVYIPIGIDTVHTPYHYCALLLWIACNAVMFRGRHEALSVTDDNTPNHSHQMTSQDCKTIKSVCTSTKSKANVRNLVLSSIQSIRWTQRAMKGREQREEGEEWVKTGGCSLVCHTIGYRLRPINSQIAHPIEHQ